MMWTVLLSLLTLSANAKTIKIAVIDTGFDFNGKWNIQPKLCKYGHKDFTGTGLQDNHGHGTHIAGLIAKHAEQADYCLVILKFFDPKKRSSVDLTTKAVQYAVNIKVDFINISAGGVNPSPLEQKAILNALNSLITVVAAAGNEMSNLTSKTYYPALYDERIVVVEAIDSKGNRIPASNYGPQVDYKELGHEVQSILPNNKYGTLTGTSQATAIVTGKLVKHFDNVKKLVEEHYFKNYMF